MVRTQLLDVKVRALRHVLACAGNRRPGARAVPPPRRGWPTAQPKAATALRHHGTPCRRACSARVDGQEGERVLLDACERAGLARSGEERRIQRLIANPLRGPDGQWAAIVGIPQAFCRAFSQRRQACLDTRPHKEHVPEATQRERVREDASR